MFRACLLVAALAVTANAQSGDGDGDQWQMPNGTVSKQEFTETLSAIKGALLNAADNGQKMTEAAQNANDELAAGNIAAWQTIETDTENEVKGLIASFQVGEAKLWNLIHRMYNNMNDEYDDFGGCSGVANYVRDAAASGVTGFSTAQETIEAAGIIQADIDCMTKHLATAEQIPDNFEPKTEGDAFNMLAEIYKRVYRGKWMALRWFENVEKLDVAFDAYYAAAGAAGGSRRSQEKRVINKLIKLLSAQLRIGG